MRSPLGGIGRIGDSLRSVFKSRRVHRGARRRHVGRQDGVRVRMGG